MQGRVTGRCPPVSGEQVFTVTGLGNFNIAAIHRALADDGDGFYFCRTPLDQAFIDYIWRRNDPDRAHLATMTRADVDAGFAIAVEMPGGTVQLIDGNHYILKAWELGEREMRLVIIPGSRVAEFMFDYEVQEQPDGPWRRLAAEDVIDRLQGTYAKPDGTLRDKEDRIIARLGARHVSRETTGEERKET